MTEIDLKRERRIAYLRGYTAGLNRRWPMPPDARKIPEEKIRALAQAAQALSDRTDAFLAVLEDREEDAESIAIDEARDLVHRRLMELEEAALAQPEEAPCSTG